MKLVWDGTGRLYDRRAWKRARAFQLMGDPLCCECERHGRMTAATEVDHIIALKDDGHPFDPDNLQSLCKPCHSRKTNKEDGAFGRTSVGPVKGCSDDGMPKDSDHPWFAKGAFSEL